MSLLPETKAPRSSGFIRAQRRGGGRSFGLLFLRTSDSSTKLSAALRCSSTTQEGILKRGKIEMTTRV
jgi:hypothetical protein